ncbi:hypothetical protein LXL04_018691 [Taraxacum kok-saghyz]
MILFEAFLDLQKKETDGKVNGSCLRPFFCLVTFGNRYSKESVVTKGKNGGCLQIALKIKTMIGNNKENGGRSNIKKANNFWKFIVCYRVQSWEAFTVSECVWILQWIQFCWKWAENGNKMKKWGFSGHYCELQLSSWAVSGKTLWGQFGHLDRPGTHWQQREREQEKNETLVVAGAVSGPGKR